ncbi:MAG: DUF3343 domain-containing protein [Oscillospiraceae bacterium]|jgi:hypothetical protein|nr:DUF3343 domain-containing protein [Oscillospiraceae bacterium]
MKKFEYIATFFSHFGAMSYCNALKEQDIAAKPIPVPKLISSSCGTCVYYVSKYFIDMGDCELDSVFIKSNNVFECVYIKD